MRTNLLFFWMPASLLFLLFLFLCFSAFPVSVLFCFPAFPAFPASLPFCFFRFLLLLLLFCFFAFLLLPFLCFSAFPAFLVLCFSAFLLFCCNITCEKRCFHSALGEALRPPPKPSSRFFIFKAKLVNALAGMMMW